jgi:Palmitoyl protein thioesterase
MPQMIKDFYPERNFFIHNVKLGNEQQDKQKGFFGSIQRQVDGVCEDLKEIPELAQGIITFNHRIYRGWV